MGEGEKFLCLRQAYRQRAFKRDGLGWGRWDLNPHEGLISTDFKSAASTIPPRPPDSQILSVTAKGGDRMILGGQENLISGRLARTVADCL